VSTITVLLDLPPDDPAHRFTVDALAHAIALRDADVVVEVTRTDEISELGDGIVVGPGSPYRDSAAAEGVIQTARIRGIPLVGTCGGFQHLLVEHARNVMGMVDASHAEYGGPGTAIIDVLSCSLADSRIDVTIVPGTLLAGIYGTSTVIERTNCNYGLAPAYGQLAAEGGLVVSATDETGEVRAVERVDHPFFIGTLFQPQRSSTVETAHPLWLAFVGAVVSRAAR
jgi:CTP synthase (UTP-ammonia lyase)